MTEREDNRRFCDERHEKLDKMIDKIDRNVQTIFTRLNWFYIVTISTLAAAIVAALK